ncbi:hypothetical protein [Wohlfahrtiimonas larvae]|uniref:Uncharacterized protein n=1 Tax=Wohlfahrtiimonas larvae TaxID=1157986 RepID=A0ABP9MJ64_9GAMM|nr:hypothetical protein [Wohlfahrtiimonas larvae]
MKQLYIINGKPASLWQKVLFALATIGFLILIIPLGLGILAIGAILTVVFYVYLYWKIRKIKKMLGAQEAQAYQQQNSTQNTNQRREGTIDGEYKEL